MRWLLVVSLAACGGTIHTGSSSVGADAARRAQIVTEQCAALTGSRHDTCMRLGPPRAPARDRWATARWWLYESRYWEPLPDRVEGTGPQVVCASYVAFENDGVVESDEQCHQVTRYEP